MAALATIYWLMAYFFKESFILKINFDLIWNLCAREGKKRKMVRKEE